MMYPEHLLLSSELRQAHASSWQAIGRAGDFFTGAERVAIVEAARSAATCDLCRRRKEALSPYSIVGEHDGPSSLPDNIVDLVHRIHSDPGRLTKTWFDAVMADDLTPQKYVEIVSVVTTSVIIDTLHQAMGLAIPKVPMPSAGEPRGQFNPDAVEVGGWVPVTDAPADLAEHGLPNVPNIARSMGLVPSAVELFFTAFRPHYSLSDINLSISQTQAEYVAARVSSINECYY
tara:strand:+ start:485 stop:1180 length:696 start_codon:yes stop_codon:yes gene_type:complete